VAETSFMRNLGHLDRQVRGKRPQLHIRKETNCLVAGLNGYVVGARVATNHRTQLALLGTHVPTEPSVQVIKQRTSYGVSK